MPHTGSVSRFVGSGLRPRTSTRRIGSGIPLSRRGGSEANSASERSPAASRRSSVIKNLARRAGRCHARGEIDCGADVVTLAVEDAAPVCADVQCGKLGFVVDETVHREPEFDGVCGVGEHEHERIADLLENSAAVSGCAATHRDAEPAQHIGCVGSPARSLHLVACAAAPHRGSEDGPRARRSARPVCPDSKARP
jgi:hypothetical protein